MENTPASKSGVETKDLKRQLLECLDREARQFSETARNYFDKNPLSPEDRVGLLTAVIAMIEHVMEAGDWNNSLFLRNTLKPLLSIRAEAQTELDQLQEKGHVLVATATPLANDEIEVYISLFQSDGYNINKWAMQLRSLGRYIVGRPVYQSEADVQKRLRLRSLAGANEAYVAVVIKKADVQSAEPSAKPLKDQFDLPLLLLKEVALRNGRIGVFVHQGIRYHFVDGQLIKAVNT